MGKTFAEAAIAPAHVAVALAMVLEIEGSHKNYLTIFSLQAKDLISDGII